MVSSLFTKVMLVMAFISDSDIFKESEKKPLNHKTVKITVI